MAESMAVSILSVWVPSALKKSVTLVVLLSLPLKSVRVRAITYSLLRRAGTPMPFERTKDSKPGRAAKPAGVFLAPVADNHALGGGAGVVVFLHDAKRVGRQAGVDRAAKLGPLRRPRGAHAVALTPPL